MKPSTLFVVLARNALDLYHALAWKFIFVCIWVFVAGCLFWKWLDPSIQESWTLRHMFRFGGMMIASFVFLFVVLLLLAKTKIGQRIAKRLP